jgi:thiol-disulfide isomerase/thioredoxin
MMKKLFIGLALATFSLNVQSQMIPKWKITDVEQYMKAGNGEILVLNFWATFCKPCVAEIPSFIKIADKYKEQKVKLLLISLDLPSFYPTKVAGFAKKHKFKTPIVWLDETNADYFCPKIDKNWSGSIPGTLIINTQTGYRKFFEEEMDAVTFENELKKAMESKVSLNDKDYFIDRVEPE